MLGSGGLLIACFLLFKAESARGQRLILSRLRTAADLQLEARRRRWEAWKQYFGASSLRLFLHYLLHQFLSSILYLVHGLEQGLHRLRTHNRAIAKDVKGSRSDNHLSHIAAHKASVALSPEEQTSRKERALND